MFVIAEGLHPGYNSVVHYVSSLGVGVLLCSTTCHWPCLRNCSSWDLPHSTCFWLQIGFRPFYRNGSCDYRGRTVPRECATNAWYRYPDCSLIRGINCHRIIQAAETISIIHFCCIGSFITRGECSLLPLPRFTTRIRHNLFRFGQGNNGAYSYLPYSTLDNWLRKSFDQFQFSRIGIIQKKSCM